MGSNELDKADSGQLGHHKNKDIQAKLIEGLLKLGGNVTRACKFAGCSTSHYYNMLDNSEEWKAQCYRATREAKESRLDEVQDSLYQQAVHPDKPSIIAGLFLAKTLGRTSEDPSRQYNDSPPPEPKAIEDTSKPINETSNKLAELMQDFMTTTIKANAIEGEITPLKSTEPNSQDLPSDQ